MKKLRKCWSVWCRFWFESNNPECWKLFRFVFGWLCVAAYGVRSFDIPLFFNELFFSKVPGTVSVLFTLDSLRSVWVFNGLFLISLATMACGIFPRLSAAMALVLHLSFLNRNMGVTYGFDLIATFFLLYLCFADTRSKKSELSSMALRFSQIQVCVIYFYSSLDKIRGAQWWSGEAMWGVLANTQLARFDFSFVAHFPMLVVLLTYATVAWELYFPVLVWIVPLRKPVLLAGVFLHLGIVAAIQLPFFGMLMICSYLLFWEAGYKDWCVRNFSSCQRVLSSFRFARYSIFRRR